MTCVLWGGLLQAGLVPSPAQTLEWVYHKTADGLHPDGNEQALVWLMNRARANPAAEGLFLTSSNDTYINTGISYFAVNTTLLKAEFAALAVKRPAVFDRRLYEASRQHSLYMIQRNLQTHDGQFVRVGAAGFDYQTGAASIFSAPRTILECHGGLNIDWGPDQPPDSDGMQAGRGHRAAIMSSGAAAYSNVGFAVVLESNPATDRVGPLVFSGAYCEADPSAADHHNRFLTGTVWTDANNNRQYDPGEGLGNVQVQPDQGDWHAVTGTGGGWAIPVTAPGHFQLTFSGPAAAMPMTRRATVGDVSVLVDTRLVPGQLPFVVTAKPDKSGRLVLEWTGGQGPYQVEETGNPASGPWLKTGPATSGTTLTVPLSGPRRYYRVTGS